MKLYKSLIYLYLVLTFSIPNTCFSQNTYPLNYFGPPLNLPIKLAGSFAEIRSGHYHSGFDLKTNNEEGKPVFAAGDGYVSRIKISATGYGNALYITHPNGFVSVYGHLQKYNDQIRTYARSKQYEKESFEVDLFLNPNDINVLKGEIVAYSGNTGGSESPHLHFEIRDRKTEEIINPALFGYLPADSIPPVISNLGIYDRSELRFNSQSRIFPVTFVSNGKYTVLKDLKVHGWTGFGVESFDFAETSKNGLFSLELFVDSQEVFKQVNDRFKFDDTRYVNAHIDFPEKMKSGKVIQYCFIQPNDKFPCYDATFGGSYLFKDQKRHLINMIATDVNSNKSELSFWIQDTLPLSNFKINNAPSGILFDCFKPNHFETEDFKLLSVNNSFYDTLYFNYQESPSSLGLSKIHKVHNKLTPIHAPISISIRPIQVPEDLKNKLYIATVDGANTSYVGGKWENGFVKASIRSFGNFIVMADTIPPVIDVLDFKENNPSKFKFKIGDANTGIKFFVGKIDGKWILLEMDGKTSVISYDFGDGLESGKHLFELEVKDLKDNSIKLVKSFNN